MMGNSLFLVVLNLVVTSLGGWLCICRMTKMSQRTTKLAIRAQYAVLFTVFAALGWGFLVGVHVNRLLVLLALMLVFYVAMGIPAWWKGMPSYAKREWSDPTG